MRQRAGDAWDGFKKDIRKDVFFCVTENFSCPIKMLQYTPMGYIIIKKAMRKSIGRM